MVSDIYTQLPIAKDNSICPICEKKLIQRIAHIELHDLYRSNFISKKHNILYCNMCTLPFINDAIVMELRKKYNELQIDKFTINKMSSIDYIKNRIKFRIRKRSYLKEKNIKSIIPQNSTSYEIVRINKNWAWKTSQSLISIEKDITACYKCSTTLNPDYALIPINKNQEKKIPGLFCSECDCLYVKERKKVDEVLRDNPYAKSYTLDGKPLWNATEMLEKKRKDEEYKQKHQEKKRRLEAVKSSVVMICIDFNKTAQKEEFIIVMEKDESNPEKNILHYTSIEARELLSAAFEEQKKWKGTLNEKDFFITTKPIFPNLNDKSMLDNCIPVEVKLQEGGGYHSKNINFEPIVILIYSFKSKRYELMNATYDKNNGYPFVDTQIFRTFIKNHGKPAAVFSFNKYNLSNGFDWDNLEMESALTMYGYNVSKKEGLSVTERQNLLAELIDFELLSVKQIVSHLKILINSRTGEKYIAARGKWTVDKHYVENYKMNPSRFLIASNVSKKK